MARPKFHCSRARRQAGRWSERVGANRERFMSRQAFAIHAHSLTPAPRLRRAREQRVLRRAFQFLSFLPSSLPHVKVLAVEVVEP